MRFDYEDLGILTVGSFILVPQYYLKLLKVLFTRPVILALLCSPHSYIDVLPVARHSDWVPFCLWQPPYLQGEPPAHLLPSPRSVTLREINESHSLQSQGQRRGFEQISSDCVSSMCYFLSRKALSLIKAPTNKANPKQLSFVFSKTPTLHQHKIN